MSFVVYYLLMAEEEPFEYPITDVLDLHTFRPQEVKDVVEEYLYQCHRKRFPVIRIIHGKGTGVQRKIIRSILETSPLVQSFEDGPDWGSTSVTLKVTPASSGPNE